MRGESPELFGHWPCWGLGSAPGRTSPPGARRVSGAGQSSAP